MIIMVEIRLMLKQFYSPAALPITGQLLATLTYWASWTGFFGFVVVVVIFSGLAVFVDYAR